MGGEEGLGVTTGQPNLYKQDLSKLDVSKLTALSREVISRQATINIGTIGHVAHGKSTIVKAISGVQTVRFKNELERNITIKLDARAKDNSGTGQGKTAGDTCDMSPAREKRSASPGFHQSYAKHYRIEEKSPNSREDTPSDVSASTSVDSNNVFGQEKVKKDTTIEQENTYHCDEWRVNRRSSRLSMLSNDTNAKSRYDLRNVKLKELRVILEDIKHETKGEMETLLAETDLWEVEQILAKDETDGQPAYLIKWKNWDSKYNTWEPVTNLVNCPAILDEFERSRLKLLNSFKQKTNFYPDDKDIEMFLNHRKMKGETLVSISVDLNTLYGNIRRFLNRKYVTGSKWEVVLKENILRMLVADSRMKQLRSLEKWEQDMNSITKERPLIQVENMVDLEGAPQNFYYIEDYLPGNGVIIPDDPPIGCECTGCNSKAKNCCFTQNNLMCPYTSAQKIRVPPGTPIYECNKRCRCGIDCVNRVVQRGTEVKLCIFRTSNGRGWGVKALQLIKKGTFVTEYVGEVITNEEAERRGKEYDACGRTYLFDLDYNETEEQCPYTVDAAMYGNVSHFINHSCDPNLAVYAVWIDCLDPNLPKLALFAMRDIRENEEITFDYTCQSSNSENSIKQEMPTNENLDGYIGEEFEDRLKILGENPESDSMKKKTLCKCGARCCRQYVF